MMYFWTFSVWPFFAHILNFARWQCFQGWLCQTALNNLKWPQTVANSSTVIGQPIKSEINFQYERVKAIFLILSCPLLQGKYYYYILVFLLKIRSPTQELDACPKNWSHFLLYQDRLPSACILITEHFLFCMFDGSGSQRVGPGSSQNPFAPTSFPGNFQQFHHSISTSILITCFG